jgi:hypothetical protein
MQRILLRSKSDLFSICIEEMELCEMIGGVFDNTEFDLVPPRPPAFDGNKSLG